MNGRVAKILRRESGYHPAMPKAYVVKTTKVRHKEKGVVYDHRTNINKENSSRGIYLRLKKEYKAGLLTIKDN